MHVSLSEVQTTVCKAAVAIGLPLGLGEDAGRAARRMITSGVGSFTAFVDALDAIEMGRSTGFEVDRAIAGDFGPKTSGRLLSALRAGPSACDLLATATRTDLGYSRITLTDVDVPIVILFEALATLDHMDKGQCVAWNVGDNQAIEAVCWQGSLALIKGAPDDLLATGSAEITMHLVAREPRVQAINIDQRIQRNAIEIDEAAWHRVTTYADRLLVEATETSQLTGAGAGLVDTD